MALDRLANQAGVEVGNRRCRSLTATTRIAGHEVILAKPETFMNLSGEAVRLLLKEFEADPLEDLIVLYDELDLPLGTARLKERGSPAGHNGARSVSGALRTNDWLRVRIGVGPNLPAEAVAAGAAHRTGGKDYLLSPLRKMELASLDEVLDRVANAVRVVVEQGVAAAMNELNRREPESGKGRGE
jgi:PTH1 family peptidyl-tRNA hydrolase